MLHLHLPPTHFLLLIDKKIRRCTGNFTRRVITVNECAKTMLAHLLMGHPLPGRLLRCTSEEIATTRSHSSCELFPVNEVIHRKSVHSYSGLWAHPLVIHKMVFLALSYPFPRELRNILCSFCYSHHLSLNYLTY